ncbi:cobyric acid synthase CobQ [Arenicella chitinivorans]|uniref:Cobyric acid synthase CobQ n=1 Tax=Arenicella chitinivorans TaxID=1329800 RepID=A0A918VQ66_9GAMM|nr:AAA family ATPase [Arenicella chitinivorans]GHA14244.1 cobyric acid synthase CobQ [Arenicella chitinivorans]
MAKVISVTNQKGGVGKTTTSINLSAALVKRGKRILLLDMDPQGNASVGLGVNTDELEHTIYDVLLGEATAEQAIVETESGVDVMTANGDLAGAQVELLNEIGRELRLKKALEPITQAYDYIFIDCPPALNVLTINALVASHSVMIPMQCEYFALEGLSALISTIRAIRETLNSNLKIEGLLRTMYDKRNSLSGEVSRQLETHFGNKVYDTVVPRNVRLAEAPSYGEPAISYAPHSKGARAYILLADEMLKIASAKTAQTATA